MAVRPTLASPSDRPKGWPYEDLPPFDEAKEWPSNPTFFEMCPGTTIGYCTAAPFHLPREFVAEIPRCFGRQHSFDFIIIFDIKYEIIMFAQVVDEDLEMKNKRRAKCFQNNIYYLADQQMRAMFQYLLGSRPIRNIWGLSFVNTSLRVYCGDNETREVTPVDVGANKADWDIDILGPAGFETMKDIVQDVKKNNKVVPKRLEQTLVK